MSVDPTLAETTAELSAGDSLPFTAATVADSSSTQSRKLVRMDPTSGWPKVDLRELWGLSRSLFFLVWRSV
jgi:hypothetical protein